MKQSKHIDTIINDTSSEDIINSRLRVKTSFDAARWLIIQGCEFRGSGETDESLNPGNFLKLVKLLASYNENVANIVLENAPKIAKYTSPKIQKQLLNVIANKVRNKIRKDIRDFKFYLIVDEARDESKREQMSLVLRYVDKGGFGVEHFFELAHVKDIAALTLKNEILLFFLVIVLVFKIFAVKDMMVQATCVVNGKNSHRLQLALVAASREVLSVHEFFSNSAQVEEIEYLKTIDELEIGARANRIRTLKRAGDTRWSSHFSSIFSFIQMFNAICSVLERISKDGSTYSQRGDANTTYKGLHLLNSYLFCIW
ncbi:uncharacterized protein LOC126672625 [Mercurialis annua]|uniref:uncharacterized protein LOC126672625 n=1 Tax=Mercurialis annua TaxID=3986 RepID=UPI002160B9BD|nr:uncharacterized protein LOC126672625 [Mercurialis annua]